MTLPGRFSLVVAVVLAGAVPLVSAETNGQSPFIFGVHDPGGAPHMADKRKGWILFTEELGRDPNDGSGRDYRPWADQGFGMIVRLNHGYGPANGTLPYAKHYAAFAERVLRFVAASPGAHVWIVGNEMNWDQEWPRYEGFTEEITPDRYVQAFRQVRNGIKGLPGHAGDQVIPGAIGTYGPPTAGGLSFVQYHVRVLDLLGAGGLDGIAVHTYTHGTDSNLIFDEARMGPPYEAYHYNFRAYRDYLSAHPAWARSLPVYITETDQIDPWADTNGGWVRNAYREIDDWNRTPGTQKIRSLLLYRFCPGCDRWDITGKSGVIADFRQAMDNDYRWDTGSQGCNQTVAVDRWKGEYFSNPTLSGTPSLVRDDGIAALDLDWGGGGPNACGVGSDRFSARFTRTVFFNAGTYRFTTTADDGVRLYVDGVLRIDKWIDQGPTTYTADVALGAGNHTVVMHYYENGGGAVAKLNWAFLGGGGEPLAAKVLDTSSLPATLAPGETRPVTIRVQNAGADTWTAADLVRLGAASDNTVTWGGFACGGFFNNPGDARAYLCQSVPAGGTAELSFSVTAPASGPSVLSVQMVKDGALWFGEKRAFAISAGTSCGASVPAGRWKGEYFPNTTLSGAPSLVRDDGASGLGFDWGAGGPNTCGIGTDRFSARFTRTLSLAQGTYRFTARADDGVRVWIDDRLVLDKWILQAPTTYTFDVGIAAGNHVLRMEYFENEGGAVAELSWTSLGNPCVPSVAADRWKGEYFANSTFSGAPVLVRDEGTAGLDFDWGAGSPSVSCGVPTDGFSARFARNAAFEAGTYRFTVTGDDGVRLYVDGALRLDRWLDQAPTTYSVDVTLSAGAHALRLDYYENGGGAVAKLAWTKTGGGGGTSGSKLTVHTSFTAGLSMAFVRDAKPRLLKILDNFGPAAEVKALSPGTLIVGRIYEAGQPADGDPGQRAQEWWTRNRDRILAQPAVDYWEGYNEPDASTVERIGWYAQFEAARVNLLAQNGRKACIGNFSTGTPDVTNPQAWPAFYPALDAARTHAGILGVHEYGTPMQQYFDPGSGEGWLCGRYRKVYRQFLIPSGRSLPLAITEAGVDGVAPVGWKNHYTGEQYLDQLEWYDSLMRADPYVLGATIFSLEIPGWDSFDIAPIMGALTDHLRSTP